MSPYEVLTMGRVGVDLYPLQTGVGLRDVSTFGKYLGGSATNVAVAAARLGHSSAVITRTGEDPFGEFVHQALRGYGVDDQFVTAVPGLPTPVTFCEIFPPDNFPIYFYRYPKAPDLEIDASELDYDAIKAAHGSTGSPSRACPPSQAARRRCAALEARGKAGVTVLDLDYRPTFWPSREEARRLGAGGAALRLPSRSATWTSATPRCGERAPVRAAEALLRPRGWIWPSSSRAGGRARR